MHRLMCEWITFLPQPHFDETKRNETDEKWKDIQRSRFIQAKSVIGSTEVQSGSNAIRKGTRVPLRCCLCNRSLSLILQYINRVCDSWWFGCFSGAKSHADFTLSAGAITNHTSIPTQTHNHDDNTILALHVRYTPVCLCLFFLVSFIFYVYVIAVAVAFACRKIYYFECSDK